MTGISRIAVVAGLGINCCAYAQGFTLTVIVGEQRDRAITQCELVKSSIDNIPVSVAVEEVLNSLPNDNDAAKKKRGRPKKVMPDTDPIEATSNKFLEKDSTKSI
ncbi:hypothetical protein BpHYR1_050697 [Brachionus plicatilis]|uniref:Uncharacterized protein n=1 Tax=Brachionus plicatilis TaxID=10195 RepID=A0A3M7P3F3_BRAPC|nr:hypothetical protein BpHYR1_050697 [Brachionus plicatilis]